jgi:hypothetical protein
MKELNYLSLMSDKPTEYMTVRNSLNQLVLFVEHPIKGDGYPVIAVFPEEQKAFCTDFWDCEDFNEGSEYMPVLVDGICEPQYNIR